LRFTASDRDADSASTLSWCDVDAYDDVPLIGAVRNAAMLVGSLDDLDDRYPEYVQLQRATASVALAAVPIVAGGRIAGGYLLYYDRPQAFDEQQCGDLARTGQELGAGLRRAQRAEARRPVLAPADEPVGPGLSVAEHEVAHDPAAVGEARRFLRRTLRDWNVDDDTADTAVLCLSELVTNALIHSHAGCAVRVQLEDGVLTTTVRDSGTADAASVSSLEDPLQVHGRGLRLVDALAVGWGYDLDTMGTTVWFVLDA
jgi:anti-sigma regulatory factor (Ser/Thr protein kinase)